MDKKIFQDNKTKLIATIALLVVAVSFIVVGIARGEIEVVFTRAVNICLECIGLG